MSNGDIPAFPILDAENNYFENGLTKREYFAGLAMAGALGVINCPVERFNTEINAVPRVAVELADALLAELSKEKPHD